MPISRVRCSTAMYIERHTTAKPITTADADHHVDELRQAPRTFSAVNSDVNSSIE